jgi:hypothetical protein
MMDMRKMNMIKRENRIYIGDARQEIGSMGGRCVEDRV